MRVLTLRSRPNEVPCGRGCDPVDLCAAGLLEASDSFDYFQQIYNLERE